MSLESDFKQIRIHLSRIADSLEALLAERGYVATSPTSVEVDDDDEPIVVEQPEEEVEEKPAKKKAKKKTKKKKTEKKTTVGKPVVDEPSEFSIKDVRGVLHELQDEVNQAAVKSLLKKYGASTLAQVQEKHYADIIADAKEDME